MPVPPIIETLVEQFARNQDAYRTRDPHGDISQEIGVCGGTQKEH